MDGYILKPVKKSNIAALMWWYFHDKTYFR